MTEGDFDEMRKLRWKIIELEDRLERYHEHLELAIDERDKFVLSSSWGIVSALSGMFAFFGTLYAFNNWLELTGLVWDLLAGLAAFIAWLAIAVWQQGGRDKDEKKLHRLPKWESKNQDLYD